ncbi:hypothetical protein BD309DRAFT_828945, partial [Dichomitus squalens]
SIAATLEILQHYCQLDQRYIRDIGFLDSPVNVFLVNTNSRKAFDDFVWCLKPTEVCIFIWANVRLHLLILPSVRFRIKQYDPSIYLAQDIPALVVFKYNSVEEMDTVFSTQSSTDNPSEPGTSRDSRHRKRPHDAMGL